MAMTAPPRGLFAVLQDLFSPRSHTNMFLSFLFSFQPPGGRPAPDLCFKKVNEAGDMYGNCGKDLFGKYRSCKER